MSDYEPTDTNITRPTAISDKSILSILATMPSGLRGTPLSYQELGTYLATHYDTQAERTREKRHCIRDEIYRDGGVDHMKSVIDAVIADPDVRLKRKAWVEHARFTNPLKRVVNRLSTVYAKPARRGVGGSKDNQQKYQDMLDAVSFDEQMLQLGRLLNLHRVMLARVRVRETSTTRDLPDGTQEAVREPVLDYVSPANVRAVLHPNDSKLVIGWLIRSSYKSARPDLNAPAWTLWTDYERVQLRENFSVIADTYIEHNIGRNPWVAVALSPIEPGYWPGEEGEDLVAAAVASWFTRVLMLKETKSATKLPAIQGDGTNTARGQAADSENPIELSDGQSVTTVDLSMDLTMFQDVDDHIVDHVAQDYGLAADWNAIVQSAAALETRNLPLKELREQQQVPLRRFERELVLAAAAVLKQDEPAIAFEVKDFSLEFSEPMPATSRTDETNLAIIERQAGLDSTVNVLARRNNVSREVATDMMRQNIEDEDRREEMMRPRMAASGAAAGAAAAQPAQAAATDPAKDPATAPIAAVATQAAGKMLTDAVAAK